MAEKADAILKSSSLVSRLKKRVSSISFYISRIPLWHPIVRFVFAHASFMLPVARVENQKEFLAFRHPRPFWRDHYVAVPKHSIQGIMSLSPDNAHFVVSILEWATKAGPSLVANPRCLALLVNGGKFQDVGQIHFHIAGGPDVKKLEWTPGNTIREYPGVLIIESLVPQRPYHVLLEVPNMESRFALDRRIAMQQLTSALQELVIVDGLEERGFTVQIANEDDRLNLRRIHLVGG